MGTFVRALAVAVVVALTGAAGPAQAGAGGATAEAAAAPTSAWVVTLGPGTADVGATARAQLAEVGAGAGARPLDTWGAALRGYAAELTAAQARALAAEPGVAAVEPDRPVHAQQTQTNAPWGLDRIDQRNLPLSTTYTYTATGRGVTAYVVDTGIRFTHQDFGGRAVTGTDVVDGGPATDCNGHGTHMASVIGGTTYGVAKQATLVAVRVLNCSGSGTTSGVVAGIDWAVAHHQPGRPAVANLSIGGGPSTALDAAVNRLVSDGVAVVTSAGASNSNACNFSPGRVPAALTVAATTTADAITSFSNWGPCVDVLAPGTSITAAWHTSDTATNTLSGTSVAAALVAGVVAKLLQADPTATPATIANRVVTTATPGVVTGLGTTGTPNRLLYTNS